MMKDQAEKLREIIKKNTKEMKKKCNAKIITVTSGKGGVGKSNVAVNLGLELVKKGKKTLIIDADLGLANVEILMGEIPKYNLKEVIDGTKVITDIISDGPDGIKFISGGSGIGELANVSEDKLNFFAQNLGVLDEMFDVIIIDTGAGISDVVMVFAKIADLILLVTTQDPTSITDAYALLKVLKNEMDDREYNVNVIVNMVKSMKEAQLVFDKLNLVCKKFLNKSLDVIQFIPDDVSLQKAVRLQKPVTLEYPKSSVTLALKNLSENVLKMTFGNEEEINQQEQIKKRGLMELINSLIGKEL